MNPLEEVACYTRSYRTGMGNFESDEGQYQGARLLIHVHTPFTQSYSISCLLKEVNE